VRGPGLFAIVGVVLVALTLRGPVASVGPLLSVLQRRLGLSSTAGAALTSLPLLCFGLLAPLAPRAAARLGMHRTVLGALGMLGAGIALRLLGVPGLYAGTLLIGVGIAIINVLLLAIVKLEFAHRLALVTGLVISAMSLSATLGAGLAQPLTGLGNGVDGSLALWLVPVGGAALAWVFSTRGRRPGRSAAPAVPARVLVLLRDPIGRAVTIFFGLQSLAFYTMLAWLPQLLQDDAGLDAANAGLVLAFASSLGVPAGFVIPRVAVRMTDQRLLVPMLSTPTGVGLLGLLLAPAAAPWLWSLLLGLGTGVNFSLALTLVLLRSRDGDQAGRLSAAAQGVGYVLAASGPLAVGVVHDITRSWAPCLVLLVALTGAQVAFGLRAGRPVLLAAQ
jgi:CP family cyanate transporter-like MFS transporter